VTVVPPTRWACQDAQVPLLPFRAAGSSLAQEHTAVSSGTLCRSPMSEGQPDEGCLHIPLVAPGPACDLPDADDFVTFTSGKQSEVAS